VTGLVGEQPWTLHPPASAQTGDTPAAPPGKLRQTEPGCSALTFSGEAGGGQRRAGHPVAPQLVAEGGDAAADVAVRGGLQEESHLLPGQPAEAADAGPGGLRQQQLQHPLPLQVELSPPEGAGGFDAGGDVPGAPVLGSRGGGGQAGGQAEAKGPHGVQPFQRALGAVQGELLYAAGLLRQPAARHSSPRQPGPPG